MVAKDEAKDLVNRFYISKISTNRFRDREAKQCALICVDKMLELAYDVEWEKREDAVSKVKFLKEVKQELINL